MTKHHHEHEENISGSRLLLTIILNVVITSAEAVGGLLSGSLALLSDALHNFSDVFAVIISYVAVKLSEAESSHRRTFGLKRAEVLAALVNSVVLLFVALFLFREAVLRIIHPQEIDAVTVLVVAAIGLLGNLMSVFLLSSGAKKSLNVRSAFLHMLADAFSSVAVILAAIAMMLWKVYLVDPILTILIGIYVLKEGYEILSQSVRILMQLAPDHINIYEIKSAVESMPGVKNLHHVHLWQLSDNDVFFEGHVEAEEDIKLSQACSLIQEISEKLKSDFGIDHVTIQFEYEACKDRSIIKKRRR